MLIVCKDSDYEVWYYVYQREGPLIIRFELIKISAKYDDYMSNCYKCVVTVSRRDLIARDFIGWVRNVIYKQLIAYNYLMRYTKPDSGFVVNYNFLFYI